MRCELILCVGVENHDGTAGMSMLFASYTGLCTFFCGFENVSLITISFLSGIIP